MPAIIIALVAARIAATRISDSFDDGLIHLNSLPFLEEAPPPELNFLTAGNAMAQPVVVLPDVCKVRRIVEILNSCSHNGFPVVGSKLETMHYVCGLILRQQIEVILRDRLWGHQSGKKVPLSYEVSFRHCSLPQFQ